MTTFEVADMSCSHCAGSITKAVQAVDAGARVSVDLALHRVTVEASQATPEALRAAIAGAGYTPMPVAGSGP